jgi:uncharacterized protein (DUF58 family)
MRREKILVWPGGLWLIFGPVLICMWVAAVNFANNLVYAILYLVASLSFISIFHTWRNLAAVRVEHIRIHPAFAGEDVRVEVHLRNVAKHLVYGLVFARYGDEADRQPLRRADGRTVRLEPQDTAAIDVSFTAGRRGLYRFDSIVIRSAFPFGLFWSSILVPVGEDYYVYPKPVGVTGWPALREGPEGNAPSTSGAGDDFAGVRAYVPGESLRHVDWKAVARGRPLSVKQFSGGGSHELWLDAAEMARLPLEARLSQLALWIVNAEKAEMPYALRLGRITLPLGLGPAHSRRALEALAVAGMTTA